MTPGPRAFVIVIALVAMTGDAFAVTSPFQRHWRWRSHSPPLPYPEVLHPEDPLPLPEGFTITIVKKDAPAVSADATIDKPRDVANRLATCWTPPEAHGSDPREVTIRASFSRSGVVLGEPRITYANGGPAEGARAAVIDSIRKAVSTCGPLRFTASLGKAIAGYPFAIRFIADGANPQAPSH
jgi:hypothetical protein